MKRLYDAYAEILFRYLHSLTGSRDTALDLLQDVYLKVSSFQGKVRNEKSWIFQIARNTFLNEMRSRTRRREIPWNDEVMDHHPGTGENEADENLFRQEVLESLQKEGGRFPDVFHLRVDGGLGPLEIGKILGVSEKTVRRDLEKIAHIVRKTGGLP